MIGLLNAADWRLWRQVGAANVHYRASSSNEIAYMNYGSSLMLYLNKGGEIFATDFSHKRTSHRRRPVEASQVGASDQLGSTNQVRRFSLDAHQTYFGATKKSIHVRQIINLQS